MFRLPQFPTSPQQALEPPSCVLGRPGQECPRNITQIHGGGGGGAVHLCSALSPPHAPSSNSSPHFTTRVSGVFLFQISGGKVGCCGQGPQTNMSGHTGWSPGPQRKFQAGTPNLEPSPPLPRPGRGCGGWGRQFHSPTVAFEAAGCAHADYLSFIKLTGIPMLTKLEFRQGLGFLQRCVTLPWSSVTI